MYFANYQFGATSLHYLLDTNYYISKFCFTICILNTVELSLAILNCSVFADMLWRTVNHSTEEGRLSIVEGAQYVSKFDVLSRSFAQHAIDGTLHHPAPVNLKYHSH